MQTSDSSPAPGALDGIRVVDFGQYLAGPLAALFLADNGADVIHVDPPGGPRWDHPVNAALNRGKRVVELDLKTGPGQAEAWRLAESADIVIENFRPGVMARLGLAAESLAAANDRLIWCSLPGFPAGDPRASLPGWEGVVSSAASLYPQPGFGTGDPMFSALPLASNFAAFMAAHRIAGALLARLRSGRGQRIEVSLYEACFQAIGQHGELPESRDIGRERSARMAPVMRVRQAADGTYLYFDTPYRGLQAFLDRFLPGYDLLNLDDVALQRLASDLDELIPRKAGAEWERIGQEELKGSFGLVQPSSDWLRDRHALDSGTVVEVDDPELGRTVQPGYPVLLSHTPARVRGPRRAAVPGAGQPAEWLAGVREDPAIAAGATGLPLEGVRVLDCSTLLAGPTTARILAQYGAEVIKVDRAGIATGDVHPLSDDNAALCGARTVSAGKRMVFLDLKHPGGQEIIRAIVAGTDIVHHNFTPSAAARLGLSAQQVRDLNGSAIFSTMSLHSHGGFRAEYRGHDFVGQMISGMGTRMGGAAEPKILSILVNDHAAGHLSTFGIMLALLHRNRTGEGQEVNASLSRTATMHQFPFMVGFAGRVWDEPSGLDAVGWHALDRLYRAQDGWFYLAHGDLAGGRAMLAKVPVIFDSNDADGAGGIGDVSDDDLAAWLESRFAGLPVEDCVAALTAAGFGAHRYVDLPDLLADDYVYERSLMTVVEHPGIGRALGTGCPVLGSADGQQDLQVAARRPGMDTIDVVTEHGFGDQALQLLREGVIAVGERPVFNMTTTPGYWTMTTDLKHGWSPEQVAPVVQRITSAAPSPAFQAPGHSAGQQ